MSEISDATNGSSSTHAVTLEVDGSQVQLIAAPTESLLRALRANGHTAPKPSCESGYCGGCTVLVDGEPVKSCLVPVERAAKSKVETAAGLSLPPTDELRDALLRHGGFQCGYCASGIVTRLAALIAAEPTADEGRIREALGSNICRCTGYEHMVAAALELTQVQTAGRQTPDAAMGAEVPQQQAQAKLTGAQRYTSDLVLPGMLHAKILRSPYAHARVRSIDTTRALAAPGVVAVVTFEDVPAQRYNSAFRNPNDSETLRADERVLNEKARFEGDRIAAVAALTEQDARAALELIDVDWEILPAVLDPEAALDGDAEEIHDGTGNVAAPIKSLSYGEPATAWANAPVKVEGTFRLGSQQHVNLEPKTVIASWEGQRVVIYATTQVPFHVRTVISHALGLSQSDTRVIALDMGGGQGERSDPADEYVAVVLAQRTGRPVKIQNTREEQFTSTRVRHPAVIHSRLGAEPDGTLTVRDTRATIGTGGYATMGYRVMLSLGLRSAALYRVPNIEYEGRVAYTTTGVGGGMRGFGSPQAAFAIESQLDELADQVGIDPIEIRIKNVVREGDPYLDLPDTWKINSNKAVEGLEVVRRKSDWDRKRQDLKQRQPDGLLRGIGVALGSHISTVMPYYRDHGDALIQLHEDGKVLLTIGVPDTGTGSSTVFAQIAAEELGVPVDQVMVATGDTDLAPYDQGAHSSRTTYVAGNATRIAAARLKEQLRDEAALHLEANPEDLVVEHGVVSVRGQAATQIRFDDLAHWIRYESDHPHRLVASGSSLPVNVAPPYAVCVAEIVVDPGTGIVRVESMIEAIDCGRPVNPMFVRGQLHGAMHMGIGSAICEELVYDDSGCLLTRSFAEYQVLRAGDMPKIETIILDSEESTGPFGAKGLGEASVVPIAPAIANAFAHATGVRPHKLPLTPERVLRLLGHLA